MSDNGNEEIKIAFPKQCPGCGVKFKGHKKQFVMLALPVPGLALFGCPKCGAAMFNPNAFSNLTEIQEKNAKRQAISVVKAPLLGIDGNRIN